MPDNYRVGEQITFKVRIAVQDNSPALTGVIGQDTFDPDFTYVGRGAPYLDEGTDTGQAGDVVVTLLGDANDPTGFTLETGTLQPGDVIAMDYWGTFDAVGEHTNTWSLQMPSGATNQSSNSVQRTVTVNEYFKLDVNKSHAGTEQTGQNITYTVVVTNTDLVNPVNKAVAVRDILDSGASVQSITPQGGTSVQQPTATSILWNIGTMLAGASATLTYVVTYAQTGTKSNTATIELPTANDVNIGQNSDTDQVVLAT